MSWTKKHLLDIESLTADEIVIVLDTAKGEAEPPRPLVLFNPEIVALGSELREHEEGCLSIPGVRIDIERPSAATVRFLDREGKRQ